MEQPEVRIPRSQVTVKTVITVAATLLAFAALVFFAFQAGLSLTVTAIAAILAVALDHAVNAMARLKIGRRLAVTIVMLLLVGLFVGVGFLFVPPTVEQVRSLIESVPGFIERVRQTDLYRALESRVALDERFNELLSRLPGYAQGALDAAVRAVSRLLTILGAALTIFVLIIFMLLFGPNLVRRLLDEATPERRARYQRVLGNIYRSLGGYIGGLAIVVVTNAAFTTTYLAIIRVPYFLPLGVLAGLSSLIPLVGNTLAGILITLVALAAVGFWKAIATAVYFIVYQQFENQVLGPLVYKQTVHVNPLVSLVAVLVFTELAGITGALAAVPIVAVAQVVLREALSFRRERLHLPPAPPPPERRRGKRWRRKRAQDGGTERDQERH
ncbi:MAG: AI-2E family transporter [Myxococcales bacterium]